MNTSFPGAPVQFNQLLNQPQLKGASPKEYIALMDQMIVYFFKEAIANTAEAEAEPAMETASSKGDQARKEKQQYEQREHISERQEVEEVPVERHPFAGCAINDVPVNSIADSTMRQPDDHPEMATRRNSLEQLDLAGQPQQVSSFFNLDPLFESADIFKPQQRKQSVANRTPFQVIAADKHGFIHQTGTEEIQLPADQPSKIWLPLPQLRPSNQGLDEATVRREVRYESIDIKPLKRDDVSQATPLKNLRKGNVASAQKRKRLSLEQLMVLQSEFSKNQNWSSSKVEALSQRLGLTRMKVYKWRYDRTRSMEAASPKSQKS